MVFLAFLGAFQLTGRLLGGVCGGLRLPWDLVVLDALDLTTCGLDADLDHILIEAE